MLASNSSRRAPAIASVMAIKTGKYNQQIHTCDVSSTRPTYRQATTTLFYLDPGAIAYESAQGSGVDPRVSYYTP